jgi:hypothetical protein
MKSIAYISACAGLHRTGLYSSIAGFTPWQAGQSGPADVQRNQVYDQPLPGFGKLHIADKLAFSAASLMLPRSAMLDGETTGISLGTAFGSFSCDMRYMESVASGFPSPALFSATLPSSPVAEVAIHFKLKGPNRVIAGGPCPGLYALECAMAILDSRKAESMVVMLVNGLDNKDATSALLPEARKNNAAAFSLLIHKNKPAGRPSGLVSLEGNFCHNAVAVQAEESYFLDIVQAFVGGSNVCLDLLTPAFKGKLCFTKGN